MRVRIALLAFAGALLAPAVHAQGISWSKDLTTAFAEGKEKQKIIMVCVNAKYVRGRKTEEPAAKGLREVVYKNGQVITRSREFICALLTPGSASAEFGELRLLGIEGEMISPQHIFIDPDGTRILFREEYWRYGKGEPAVKALLDMMAKAEAALSANPGGGGTPKEVDGPPASGDERLQWIGERIAEVKNGTNDERKAAVDALVKNDKGGDCVNPLLAALEENKKKTELVIDVIRGLGRDQLLDADAAVAGFLTHKDPLVRGNAAVSLEYIGSKDPKIVAALRKAAGKEKEEIIASHMFRALGRCGVGDSKTRSFLLKKISSARSEFASYGPMVGLAYFEGDAKAARGVEKQLKKIGVPGGRRGGGQNTVKRGVLCFTLAHIGDPKSAKFMREELIKKLENVEAFWVGGLRTFYRTTASACEGDPNALGEVAQGVRGFVGYAKRFDPERYDREARSMMDECRKGRNSEGFVPKGESLLGN